MFLKVACKKKLLTKPNCTIEETFVNALNFEQQNSKHLSKV